MRGEWMKSVRNDNQHCVYDYRLGLEEVDHGCGELPFLEDLSYALCLGREN